ncbi:FkbM family methyltransferase [Flavobacterium sp. HNIBRBA15423]|uniref:FkbM family methyltransferase n=1 Tax=Flavobacterium sp. HNIBRBA15423 TaxID=3458683 RepID=UPI00404462CB
MKTKLFLNSNLKFDIVKFPTPELYRRIKLLKNNNISIVLDVGANIGQYGSELRSIGYKGKIISFEPTEEAYEKLSKVAKKDPNWEVHNISLGEFDGWTEINISKNSVSSSILNNLPQLTESAPNAIFINKEKIQVKKLDSIFDSLNIKNQNIYFKIDTQGYENMVLEGAKYSLSLITAIQIEMSLVPTYEGALSFEQMSEKLKNLNFETFSIESGYYDKQSGRLLEVDGVFIKN